MARTLSPTRETRALPRQDLLHGLHFGGTLAAHESFYHNRPCAYDLSRRANTSARYLQRQTSIYLRRHDETQTRRRAAAFARWEMGRVPWRRCGFRAQDRE